jgi:hypothetical protein
VSGIDLHAPRKYSNRTTLVGDQAFDSAREARRYQELLLLTRAGEVRELERQPEFPIHAPIFSAAGEVVGLVVVGSYYADFRYRDRSGQVVVEDAKGVRTAVYRLKRRLTIAQYGIQIVEV